MFRLILSRSALTLLLAAALTGCSRPAASMDIVQPVQSYIRIGKDIKRCWFNANDPLLPGYVYRARVSSDGGPVQILIHRKTRWGLPGALSYVINFKPDGTEIELVPDNVRMPDRLAEQMHADLARWQHGETGCIGEAADAGTGRQRGGS